MAGACSGVGGPPPRGGRPHLAPEIRDVIASMSRDNRLWGTERIRGELLKLGIVVSSRSIRRYRWGGPARSPSQTWHVPAQPCSPFVGRPSANRAHADVQDAVPVGIHR